MFRLTACTVPTGATGARLKTAAPFPSSSGFELPVTKSLGSRWPFHFERKI